jgi:hypothetical protein
MTKDDIDKLWNQAMTDAIKNGEDFTRHRFANLVAAAEREACAKVLDEMAAQDKHSNYYVVAAKAIRARGNI